MTDSSVPSVAIGRPGGLTLAGVASLTAAAAAAARIEARSGAATAAGPAPGFALTRPLHIGMVGLVVRDLARMRRFYEDLLGLAAIAAGPDWVQLGAGGRPLLALGTAPDAPVPPRRAAGLYHTAFLMPDRQALGRWLLHVARLGVPLTGFADHDVSEAIYLDDPEGNGIEVYADRDPASWRWSGSAIVMGTRHLDLDGLVAGLVAMPAYGDAPENLRIGHVHLKVGELATAEAFYGAAVGLDRMLAGRGASFLASGGYHHHLGLNVWESHGAGRRAAGEAGLGWFSFAARGEDLERVAERLDKAGVATASVAGGFAALDPWGTEVRFMMG
jgi:catechol 2,3-dioxygenase